MKEIKREVKVIQVDLTCPKCKDGFMISKGKPVDDTYIHVCSNCKNRQRFKTKYPYAQYELKE